MSSTITLLVVIILLAIRSRRYSKANELPFLERLFTYSLYFTLVLFLIDRIISGEESSVWIWHLYSVALVLFCFFRKELRPLRMFYFAFAPIVAFSFFRSLVEAISEELTKSIGNYLDNGVSVSFIWMIAILYSQNRQSKIAEKERVKRKQEDELNRAIAIRKVELEALVTERTAELTQQKEELEHALSELKAAQSQLIQSEKMASLGELTAGIAHEIQNPLNFVNNFSEVSNELLEEMEIEIEKGNTEEAKLIAADLKQNLEKINHHGRRADSIVKGMLLHSRASSGQKEPSDINAIAEEYLRLAYHGLRAKDKSFNAKLETDLDASVGKVAILPQDFGRVILNLVTNAFYAVNDKKRRLGEGFNPTVQLSTKKLETSIEITVKDNGSGIPEKIIDKIFHPFYTTKPTGEGTGLGLSLCYEIITKGHGGEITVESIENEGSVFKIRIPL